VEETAVSPEVKQQQQVADSLFIINSFAQKHFSANLFKTDEGKDVALSYLKQRGFREEVIGKFQLGYNLEQRDDLAKAALSNQFNLEYLQKAGLVVVRNDAPADNYRGRIIFPIHNTTGKILGFGARVIKTTEKAPKYINTPENEIYVKSKVLYGAYFARQSIDKLDECLLVEGYTDVVSLHQAGIENVVASGGTSLTIDQLRLIRKFTNNLIIIYDGDSAGIKAALRGLDMALEEGLNVQLVLIPDKEDPDSYVNKIGAAAFREFISTNKKDFVVFQMEVMLNEAGTDTNKKATVVNTVAETLSRFNKAEDFTKQQDYIRRCAAFLRIDEGGLTNLVNKFKRDKIERDDRKPVAFAKTEGAIEPEGGASDEITDLLYHDVLQERSVIRVLLKYGLLSWNENMTMADYIFEELDFFHIESPELNHILNVFRNQYDEGVQPTLKSLLYHDDALVRQIATNIDIVPYELSPNWEKKVEGLKLSNPDVGRQDVLMSVNYYKLRKIKKMFDENQREMETVTDFTDQMELIKIHNQLKEEEQKITRLLGTVILK
jgi:DNA primase